MFNLSSALLHLRADPIMKTLIETLEPPIMEKRGTDNLFAEVLESIISQQLSVKVADIITARVYALLEKAPLTPESIIQLDTEQIRGCGVSYAKINYMKSAATAALEGRIDFAALPDKSDDEVIAELVKIHGVGKWTAEMLLIFSLQRPDIFSVGDLGLRTAVSKLYGVDRSNLLAIESISHQWSPYRSVASRYLWKSLDASLQP